MTLLIDFSDEIPYFVEINPFTIISRVNSPSRFPRAIQWNAIKIWDGLKHNLFCYVSYFFWILTLHLTSQVLSEKVVHEGNFSPLVTKAYIVLLPAIKNCFLVPCLKNIWRTWEYLTKGETLLIFQNHLCPIHTARPLTSN